MNPASGDAGPVPPLWGPIAHLCHLALKPGQGEAREEGLDEWQG